MNQLQAIAMNEGIRRRRGLWSEKGRTQLESLSLPPWTNRRRQELLKLLDRFDPSIEQLNPGDRARSGAGTGGATIANPSGSGPVTALAFVLVLGTVSV